jgi:hypothetical protein
MVFFHNLAELKQFVIWDFNRYALGALRLAVFL